MLSIFSYASQPFMYFIWRNVYLSSLPFLMDLFVFVLELEFFIYSRYYSLSEVWFANIFCQPTKVGCLLTVLMVSSEARVLNFYKVQFINFIFCCSHFFGVISKKTLSKLNSWSSPLFISMLCYLGCPLGSPGEFKKFLSPGCAPDKLNLNLLGQVLGINSFKVLQLIPMCNQGRALCSILLWDSKWTYIISSLLHVSFTLFLCVAF